MSDIPQRQDIPERVEGLPNLCGEEASLEASVAAGRSRMVFGDRSPIRVGEIDAASAIALHMHQPLIPAGGHDLSTAAVIGNLQHMQDNQGIGDNHNAPVFRWCYARMGEFIPNLVAEGNRPRVMLDYSGTLFDGLRTQGAGEVIDALRRITREPQLRDCVEWLGTPWGHAVAPSTPVQDYRLHVRAWQHHFAAIFGWDALGRVRGFSPSEMALPNQPDVAYEFVKTLRDCGFEWVLVQEHTVELPDGGGLQQRHLPHRLVCTNSAGESAEIIAVIKTQGSDTKLVAQMQPYYEAKGLGPVELAGKRVPQLVTQVADGENGGVMMNEFPGKYHEVVRECTGSRTPLMNVTEYLEQLYAAGIRLADLPACQPVHQHKIWQRFEAGGGPAKLAETIEELRGGDHRFHVEGGSWTSDMSWVKGYDNVLIPMERASSRFHEQVLARGVSTADPGYRKALYHLLGAQTSCYRYWGQGTWTDYGAEMARRAIEAADQLG